MISPKFYSTISVCGACKGWGTETVPAENYKKLCPECSGEGVALFQTDNTYLWDAPFFVDYRTRMRVKIVKVLLSVLMLTVIVGIILIMFAFFNSIFKF